MSTRAEHSVFADRGDPITRGIDKLAESQTPAGCWTGDYSGPLFLLPSLVATRYIIGAEWSSQQRADIDHYLFHHQNADGGWGLHVEDQSRLYSTLLNFIALRLLGHSSSEPRVAAARDWALDRGGATALPLWGKFLLALLNLFDYRGLPPLPPEMWLLPPRVPIHPSRLWCHSRMVLLPMTYLYGARVQAPLDERLLALREEVFATQYTDVSWATAMSSVASTDAYRPYRWGYRAASHGLRLLEYVIPERLRQRALDHVLDLIDHEDRSTDYICLGPINKLLNTLCWHVAEPGGDRIQRHTERLDDYLVRDEQGLRMNGYNSSRLWDTAFAVRAICATGRAAEYRQVIRNAAAFIDRQQIREDVANYQSYYRHPSRGGWPFSDRCHGWPISDCTALGLEASLDAAPFVVEPLAPQRIEEAVELILSWQNHDGGWATYELTRGPEWLEHFNATSAFAEVMIDYSYVECTSACLQALSRVCDRATTARRHDLRRSMERGRDFLLRRQRSDGSWYGSWGICFTYGTWYGVAGLRACGLPADHPAVRAAADFLERYQLPDGGWGETIASCSSMSYRSTDVGQSVMTAWALLSLVQAGRGTSPAARRAAQFLERRQVEDGSWPTEHIAGVFNKTCAIHYDNYLKVFPLWALARFARALDEQSHLTEEHPAAEHRA